MSILVKHFVASPTAIGALGELDVSEEEKQTLAETITLIYHQKLMNKFLEVLAEEDKKLFLQNYLNGEQEEAVEFLHSRIEKIEEVVAEALEDIESKIVRDIKDLKGS